jgi:hypothetical protein
MYEILRNCYNINLFTEKGKEDKITENEGSDLICSKKEEESFKFNALQIFIKMKDEADTY